MKYALLDEFGYKLGQADEVNLAGSIAQTIADEINKNIYRHNTINDEIFGVVTPDKPETIINAKDYFWRNSQELLQQVQNRLSDENLCKEEEQARDKCIGLCVEIGNEGFLP
jgi:hypothetical protein